MKNIALVILVIIAMILSGCDNADLVTLSNDTHTTLVEARNSNVADFVDCQAGKSLADALKDCTP